MKNKNRKINYRVNGKPFTSCSNSRFTYLATLSSVNTHYSYDEHEEICSVYLDDELIAERSILTYPLANGDKPRYDTQCYVCKHIKELKEKLCF